MIYLIINATAPLFKKILYQQYKNKNNNRSNHQFILI